MKRQQEQKNINLSKDITKKGMKSMAYTSRNVSSRNVFDEALEVIESSMIFMKETKEQLPKDKKEQLVEVSIKLINYPDPNTEPSDEEQIEIRQYSELIDLVWNMSDELRLLEKVKAKEKEYNKAKVELSEFRQHIGPKFKFYTLDKYWTSEENKA